MEKYKINGKEVKKKELRIYDEDGKELEEIEAKEKIERFWKQIYQTHQNKIKEYWNQEDQYPDHVRTAASNVAKSANPCHRRQFCRKMRPPPPIL